MLQLDIGLLKALELLVAGIGRLAAGPPLSHARFAVLGQILALGRQLAGKQALTT